MGLHDSLGGKSKIRITLSSRVLCCMVDSDHLHAIYVEGFVVLILVLAILYI